MTERCTSNECTICEKPIQGAFFPSDPIHIGWCCQSCFNQFVLPRRKRDAAHRRHASKHQTLDRGGPAVVKDESGGRTEFKRSVGRLPDPVPDPGPALPPARSNGNRPAPVSGVSVRKPADLRLPWRVDELTEISTRSGGPYAYAFRRGLFAVLDRSGVAIAFFSDPLVAQHVIGLANAGLSPVPS